MGNRHLLRQNDAEGGPTRRPTLYPPPRRSAQPGYGEGLAEGSSLGAGTYCRLGGSAGASPSLFETKPGLHRIAELEGQDRDEQASDLERRTARPTTAMAERLPKSSAFPFPLPLSEMYAPDRDEDRNEWRIPVEQTEVAGSRPVARLDSRSKSAAAGNPLI